MAKKELVAKPDALPETHVDDDDFMGFLPRAETSDFEIARLTLIQPTSKVEGTTGDIIDSSTGQKVSGLNEKLVFVPVWFFKDFSVTEVDSNKFRRNEPKTPDNAHFAFFDNRVSTDPDGVSVKRNERLNLFVVQESTLNEDLPRVYKILIKPSSFKEAKKFLSEWDIQIRSRIAPFQFLWSVTPKQITNEKGKFAIYEFAKVLDGKVQKRVTAEQLEKVKFWVKTLSKNQEAVQKSSGGPDEDEAPKFESSIPF